MTKSYCTIIFSIVLFSAVVTALEIDYFWQDYEGKVPNDAFVAVQSIEGYIEAYIGQSAMVNIGTLPGTLRPDATSLTVTAKLRNHTTSTNLKILGRKHSCKFQWAKIHYDDIKVLKKFDFLKIVHGGEESGEEVYIGRLMHEGSVQVGKVTTVGSFRGLAFPNINGSATIGILEFEILLYVPGCA